MRARIPPHGRYIPVVRGERIPHRRVNLGAIASLLKEGFSPTARIFCENGYHGEAALRDADARERGLFLQLTNRGARGWPVLADLRMPPKMSARFEPQVGAAG